MNATSPDLPASPPTPPPPPAMETAGEGKDERSGAAALNPGIPIRGIKMKFAVLAGLVEVGEVSNRDIVETAFNLVS